MTASDDRPASPDLLEPDPPPTAEVSHRAERRPATVVILAIDLLAVVLTLANVHGPLRLVLGTAFILAVPGWAVVGYLHLDWPAAEVALGISTSLAITVLGSQVMLWTHTWDPVTYQVVIGIAAAALLADQVRRARRNPATAP
jgi:uncharacterized membrane protein